MPKTTNVQQEVLGEPGATVASGAGTDLFGPADVSDSVQKGERVSPCALELFAGSCKLSISASSPMVLRHLVLIIRDVRIELVHA